MSSAADLDISVVNYARLHSLSVNYLAESLPEIHIETLQQGLPGLLADGGSLPCIDVPIHVNNTEHLIVDKGAAILLQNANNGITGMNEIESIILPLLDSRHTKKLRIEIALLRTNHASDVISFARWEDSHIRDGCLPMEPLDIEMDVGLEFPQKLGSLPAKLMTEFKGEKLEVKKETMIYLQSKIRKNWTTKDEADLWDKTFSCEKNTLFCPLTPPLLPMYPPPIPYIPSSPACHLPVLSDPASLISQDLQDAERDVFEEDKLISSTKDHNSFSSPSATISNNSNLKLFDAYLPSNYARSRDPSPMEPLVRLEDRKMEVPLLPVKLVMAPLKTVKFSETVSQMILDPFSRPAEGGERDSSIIPSEEEIDKFFQDAFRAPADEAIRRIEQEQLQEADANARVEIPIMDFMLPDPPWTQTGKMGGRSSMAAARKTELIDILGNCGHLQIWPGVRNLEPNLRWTVFPRELAQVALEETFENEEVLRAFLDHSKDSLVIDSCGLIWKPLGFRILKEDEDEEEDELQIGQFEEKQSQNIASLVKKRKILYNEGAFDAKTIRSNKIFTKVTPIDPAILENRNFEEMLRGKTTNQRATANNSCNLVPHDQKKQSTLFDGGIFSAADALDNYLEVRASKKQKPIGSVYFVRQAAVNNHSLPENQAPTRELDQSQIIHQALPIPSVNLPTSPTPYVISSAILRHRILIRTLNGLFPSAIPIERDFTAHNTTSWLPNSITRSPIASPLATEADIIISPSTGVILTTLQKIKQKPLPGQKSKSAFKGRIEKVGARYERLVILVSEGCNDGSTNGLTELDTLALAEVIGFCSSLEIAVIVQFVAGGEQTLAKWLVGAMVQYGIQGLASVPLLEEETLWELFLRRAGLNAYAAQAIIAALKAPEDMTELGVNKVRMFGITAFVEMSQGERRTRFGPLLGGVRVLDEVGRVLDTDWM